jgi:predicted  nucleic acid-binding Zn-ribbon protein
MSTASPRPVLPKKAEPNSPASSLITKQEQQQLQRKSLIIQNFNDQHFCFSHPPKSPSPLNFFANPTGATNDIAHKASKNGSRLTTSTAYFLLKQKRSISNIRHHSFPGASQRASQQDKEQTSDQSPHKTGIPRRKSSLRVFDIFQRLSGSRHKGSPSSSPGSPHLNNSRTNPIVIPPPISSDSLDRYTISRIPSVIFHNDSQNRSSFLSSSSPILEQPQGLPNSSNDSSDAISNSENINNNANDQKPQQSQSQSNIPTYSRSHSINYNDEKLYVRKRNSAPYGNYSRRRVVTSPPPTSSTNNIDQLKSKITELELVLAETNNNNNNNNNSNRISTQSDCTVVADITPMAQESKIDNNIFEYQNRITELKLSKQALKNENQALNAELVALKESMKSVKTKSQSLERRLSGRNTKLQVLESQVAVLQQRVASSASEVDSKNKLLNIKSRELDDMAAKLKFTSSHLQEVDGQLVRATKQLDVYKTELDKRRLEIEQLQSRSEHERWQFEKQLTQLERDNRRGKRLITALETSLQDLKISLEEKAMENDELNRSIQRVMEQANETIEGAKRHSSQMVHQKCPVVSPDGRLSRNNSVLFQQPIPEMI